MIYQLTNALLIPQLEAMAKEVPGSQPEPLRNMLIQAIGRKDARIFVDEKDGKVHGFIFSTVEIFEGEDACFIQFCLVLPTTNEANLCSELLARTRKWAQEMRLKTMYFMTRRNPRAFARKYKFRFHTAVLKRSV